MRGCSSPIRFRLRLILPLLALATIAGAGSSIIPEATPALVERAAQRWPDANKAQLEQGRNFYVKRCSGCHNLHLPGEKSPDDWAAALEEMAVKAHLDDEKKTAVLRYLEAASALTRNVSLTPPAVNPAEMAASASGSVPPAQAQQAGAPAPAPSANAPDAGPAAPAAPAGATVIPTS